MQQTLSGQGLSHNERIDYIKKTMVFEPKYYKKCPICKINDVRNKPWAHYCWECMMDLFVKSSLEQYEVLQVQTRNH